MNDFLDQIKATMEAGLYYSALFSCLCVPDICAAMESADGEAKGVKYKAWFDTYVAPRYGITGGQQSITGDVCYYYRCAALHQGRSTHTKFDLFDSIFFVEPNRLSNNAMKGGIRVHNVIFDWKDVGLRLLYIDVGIFCDDIINGARNWLNVVQNDANFQKNNRLFMHRHAKGLAPFMNFAANGDDVAMIMSVTEEVRTKLGLA